MELVPIGYRVLIRPDADGLERDDDGHYTSAGGIKLVGSAVDRERSQQVYGTVVALGPLAFSRIGGMPTSPEACGVKVGMKISFAKYGGAFIDHPDTKERFILLNDEDCLCGVTNG